MANELKPFSDSITFKTTYYDPSKIPPPSNVDGKMHRYRTEDVLEVLKQIEL